MKVNVTRVAKRVAKPFVDVPAWIGFKQLAEWTVGLLQPIRDLFTLKKPTQEETFAEALKHYHLTEQDVVQRIRTFTQLAILWFVISVGFVVYGVYLAGKGSWYGFLACIGVSLVTLAQAFYYHFWQFQMKERRLGCSFKEWLNANFTGRGGDS